MRKNVLTFIITTGTIKGISKEMFQGIIRDKGKSMKQIREEVLEFIGDSPLVFTKSLCFRFCECMYSFW